jgi:Flp pilus assembly protein TadG
VTARTRIHRLARNERGSVLVFVAAGLPLLALLVSFVIDVANWFEHKRHLQLQADAAALAGAGDVRFPTCANQPILDRVSEYSGDRYNPQVGGAQSAGRVHLLVNSPTYFNQSSPTDDSVRTGGPCGASMIDVKMTETDVPFLFGIPQAFGVRPPWINAHARVELKQVDTMSGFLPVGVPEPSPKRVRVTFVDEDKAPGTAGRELAYADLVKTGSSNGLAVWDNAAAPAPVKIATGVKNVGVVVALSGSTSSVTCGDSLVTCYDAGSGSPVPTTGILYARGWSGAPSSGQPAPPVARSVWLVGGSCADPYFSSSASTCTIGVKAMVDFLASGSTADPRTAVGASLTATVGGTGYPLTYDPATQVWSSSASIPVAAGSGPVNVTLDWAETSGTVGSNTCTTKGGNKCTGLFGVVQRTFAASDARSGPIRLAQISENGLALANSFRQDDTAVHQLVVRLGLQGTLDLAKPNDPPVQLRVAGGGSQNQSLNCDPAISPFKAQLAQGCKPRYTRNTGTTCPPKNALWASPQPWTCVAVETGGQPNDVAAGLNTRILGSEKPTTCTAPNKWPNWTVGERRIVSLILTPFGTFTGSGSSDTVPVIDFAEFYITGWAGQGNGFANPCQNQGDDPAPAGFIVGHFIKYVEPSGNGDGTQPCDPAALAPCVAVLTR